jgi:hypothetical protein
VRTLHTQRLRLAKCIFLPALADFSAFLSRPLDPGRYCGDAGRNEWSLRLMNMTDLLYVLTALLFFFGCWAFTKACDRL